MKGLNLKVMCRKMHDDWQVGNVSGCGRAIKPVPLLSKDGLKF